MIGPLACPHCRIPLDYRPGSGARCLSCEAAYEERYGILDLLPCPAPAVTTELRGLASENGIDFDSQGAESIKFLDVGAVETLGELMDRSRGGRIQYYQQTTSAYFEALARAEVDSHMRVAEIGAERTLWKLRVIEDLCDSAFGVNIFFHITSAHSPATLAKRVLGDMNDLPFVSGSLDLLIFSATLHHSTEIETALGEASRVLRSGGRAIVINEPVAGMVKALGGAIGHDRDHDIHEDEVTLRTWRRAIRSSGMHADHFVPAWFLNQLKNRDRLPAGTRFGALGGFAAPLARRSILADLTRTIARVPGQALLGIPLNAVLWKK